MGEDSAANRVPMGEVVLFVTFPNVSGGGNKWWVRWSWGLSLFGGASSEVRRCNCSVVV